MQPVKHLDALVFLQPLKPRPIRLVDLDPANGTVRRALPGAIVPRFEGRANAPDEDEAGIGAIWQRHLELADACCVVIQGFTPCSPRACRAHRAEDIERS